MAMSNPQDHKDLRSLQLRPQLRVGSYAPSFHVVERHDIHNLGWTHESTLSLLPIAGPETPIPDPTFSSETQHTSRPNESPVAQGPLMSTVNLIRRPVRPSLNFVAFIPLS
ncbi:hypothetical protein BDV96DRAFT_229790 [Lophiotrema nucula]|uniref:Uncharacterized protein n=1 Tax=Lophiotrema nucula TaxID=690887 RepID=A0A6A5YT96_9PLEO|nr:hypothetical protein BDV96DRAFT_229790 [Lophiotrema nucula]